MRTAPTAALCHFGLCGHSGLGVGDPLITCGVDCLTQATLETYIFSSASNAESRQNLPFAA